MTASLARRPETGGGSPSPSRPIPAAAGHLLPAAGAHTRVLAVTLPSRPGAVLDGEGEKSP